MSSWRATELAHERVREVLQPGDAAVDATAGNGHDTLFLCECVGSSGWVYACDIQQQAIDATRARLDASGLKTEIKLDHCDHVYLADRLSDRLGTVGAVMFNLGYLPGGDKTCITQRDRTLHALDAACRLLRPGGVISIVLYVGHPGGQDEATAVERWTSGLPSTLSWSRERHEERPTAPYWIGIRSR